MEFEELYRVRTLNVCYFLYVHMPPSSTKTETWFQESSKIAELLTVIVSSVNRTCTYILFHCRRE